MNKDSIVSLHLLIPMYNDWESLARLTIMINDAAATSNVEFMAHFVNDASIEQMPDDYLKVEPLDHIKSIHVIDLVCNMGHQRAIAIGLAEIAKLDDASPVLIMDSDGEDNPADIPKLVETHLKNSNAAILAQRTSRSEGLLFVVFYNLYKLLFKALTGYGISFGNFCLIPGAVVRNLIYSPNLWNSLPASALRSGIPFELVSSPRAKRIAGDSKMGFVSLILHGLHAIAVFTEIALVRLVAIIVGFNLILAVLIVLIRLTTDWVVAGWASNMVGFVAILTSLALFGLLIGTLVTLFSKTTMQMLPALQGEMLVKDTRKIR